VINLTPHPITIRRADGDWTIQPSGTVARVEMSEVADGHWAGVPIIRRQHGQVLGLQRDADGRILPCIVSSMVLAALPQGTPGVYAPDTGSTALRDERGQVIAVTRLVAA